MVLEKIRTFTLNWTIPDYCLSWILFFSIVYQKLAPLGFIFWTLSAIKLKETGSVDLLRKSLSSGNSKWFLIYYLLLILGMIWTDNLDFGLSKLENKLSFLVFPVLFFGTKLNSNLNHWKYFLIIAISFSLMLNEVVAFLRILENSSCNYQDYFFGSSFCLSMHRSYYAAYLIIGILFILELMEKRFSILFLALILVLVLGVIQTNSKMGFLSLIVVLFVYALALSVRKSWRMILWIIFPLILLIFVLIVKDSPIKMRFEETKKSLSEIKTVNNPSSGSDASRLILWNSSLLVIGENWLLGSGTGDYNDDLIKKNTHLNNTGVVKMQFNSHNQFLTTWMQLGIFGFSTLIMMFVSSFIQCKRNICGTLILVTFLLNFMVESFLEIQSGIVLFCVLLTIFFNEPKKHLEKEMQSLKESLLKPA
jgi:hypothetical protein